MQSKKPQPTALSPEERALFLENVQGIQPIKQDKIPPVVRRSKQKAGQSPVQDAAAEKLFFFSDEYEAITETGGTLSFVQQGEDPHLAGRLKRGELTPEVVLDLHGMTTAEAKQQLAGLLQYCEQQQFNCACVVHGKGLGILARKVPNWLVQHPNVRAFHTAPKSWGKHGALLLLLKINQSNEQQFREGDAFGRR